MYKFKITYLDEESVTIYRKGVDILDVILWFENEFSKGRFIVWAIERID